MPGIQNENKPGDGEKGNSLAQVTGKSGAGLVSGTAGSRGPGVTRSLPPFLALISSVWAPPACRWPSTAGKVAVAVQGSNPSSPAMPGKRGLLFFSGSHRRPGSES